MKNLLAEKKLTMSQVLVAVWILFSVLYIAQDMWRNGLQTSYRLGEQAGVRGAVTQTIVEAQKGCEPFTVFNEAGRVDLINVACLQQPQAEGAEAEAAQ